MNHVQEKKKKKLSLSDYWQSVRTPDKPDKPSKPTEYKGAVKRLAAQKDIGYTGIEDFDYPGSFLAQSDSSRVIPGYDAALKKRMGLGPKGPKPDTEELKNKNRYHELHRRLSKGMKLDKKLQFEYDSLKELFGGKEPEELSFTDTITKLSEKQFDTEKRLFGIDPKTKEIAKTITPVEGQERYDPIRGEWVPAVDEQLILNPNTTEAERKILTEERIQILIEKAITTKAAELRVSVDAMKERIAENIVLGEERIGKIQDEMLQRGVPNRIVIHLDKIAFGLIARGEEVEAAKLEAIKMISDMFPNAFNE